MLQLPPPLLSVLLGALQVGVEQVKLHASTVGLRCQHMPAHAGERKQFFHNKFCPQNLDVWNSLTVWWSR